MSIPKSKLRINQMQESLADIASHLPADLQAAPTAIDAINFPAAFGTMEETLMLIERAHQKRFGSASFSGLASATAGVVADFSSADAVDLILKTQNVGKKAEMIAGTNHVVTVDAGRDFAGMAAADVSLNLDGASSSAGIEVEGADDSLVINKAGKNAALKIGASYSLEMDHNTAGSEFAKLNVAGSYLNIVKAKEAEMQVAADSFLKIDDVAKTAELQQGAAYSLKLEETGQKAHLYAGKVKMDFNDNAQTYNLVTGVTSSMNLTEDTSWEVIAKANHSAKLSSNYGEMKALDSQLVLDHANVSAEIKTQNSYAKIVDGSKGDVYVTAAYNMGIDVTAGTANLLADSAQLKLNDAGTAEMLTSATSFAKITEAVSAEMQSDANHRVAVHSTNKTADLKTQAAYISLVGTAGLETALMQADANEKIYLQKGSHSEMVSGPAFIKAEQTKFITAQSSANHQIVIDSKIANSEEIVVSSLGKIKAIATTDALHQFGSTKTFEIKDSALAYSLKVDAQASTETLAASTFDRIEGVKSDSVTIENGSSVKFDNTAGINSYDVYAGTNQFNDLGVAAMNMMSLGSDFSGAKQYYGVAVGSAESAAGLKDGIASSLVIDLQGLEYKSTQKAAFDVGTIFDVKSGSSIILNSGAALTMDATGYGHIASTGLEIEAKGTSRANTTSFAGGAIYGSDDMSSLGLAADSDELWFMDAHKPASWSEGRGVPLTVAASEWEAFEDAFGEVSLIGAIVAAGQGGQDSFSHQIDVTGAGLAKGDSIYASANVTIKDILGVAVSTPIVLAGSTSLDEAKARIEVYVNGQRLQLGAGRDFGISLNGSNELSVAFEFDLEAGDTVTIKLA
jgi:hypothetical protein